MASVSCVKKHTQTRKKSIKTFGSNTRKCVSLQSNNKTKDTMTTQDLKDNKSRIIAKIRYQQITEMSEISKVMSRMLTIVEKNDTFKAAKATMANVDKLTKIAIEDFFKYDYVMTEKFDFAERMRENAMKNLPSSMR